MVASSTFDLLTACPSTEWSCSTRRTSRSYQTSRPEPLRPAFHLFLRYSNHIMGSVMDRPFDFSRTIKRDASLRQNNKCAHCGDELTDLLDHAHHVVPNQTGNPAARQDNWLRSLENCVVLCDTCHTRVHQDGRFRTGAV